MTDANHTPLPWKGTDSGTGIFSAGEPLGKNKIIAICTCDAVSRPKGENTANADFILRACNSHYELLAALKDCLAALHATKESLGLDHPAAIFAADNAIAKARRQP